MEEIIEVYNFEFREPNPKALAESVDERYVPIHEIADIYINGKNLILFLYDYKNEKHLYEDIVGATIPSMLKDFCYEPYKVKTAWLYECSGCYRCYPIETDVYFLSTFVVWRYFYFPYKVRKTVLVFPLEVYLKGYETLKKVARSVGIDPEKVLKENSNVSDKVKLLRRLEKFKRELERVFINQSSLVEAEIFKLVSEFEKLVEDCLFAIGFWGKGDKERTYTAIRFLKIYEPQKLNWTLKKVKNPQKRKGIETFSPLEELKILMENALKGIEEFLK